MPAAASGPGPEGEPARRGQQPYGDVGGPRFTWVPGSEENGCELSGPVPPEAVPGGPVQRTLPHGLDWQALFDAMATSGMLDGDPEDQDAELTENLAAEEDGRMGPSMDPVKLAAMVVEHIEPGPALAGWLEVAASAVPSLDENGLTGLATAARNQAAHVHAVGLKAAAGIISACAAADRRIGVARDGRPARVSRDALGQIQMALMLSHDGTEAWADLATTLSWRLPSIGAALASGWIDLDRAKAIAQVTSVLSEAAARIVAEKILPRARRLTTAKLRERLHELVIAADPDGAEERREKAERNANVRLYANDDQTATMMADKLPQIEAAAAFGTINELARARKAAGQPGTMGEHRSQVLLGLISGTLPPTPPAEGAPPGKPPSAGDDPGSCPGGSARRPPDEPPLPDEPPAGDEPPLPDEPPAGDEPPLPDEPLPGDEPPLPDEPHAAGNDCDPGFGLDPWEADDDLDGTGPAPEWPPLGKMPPASAGAVPADGKPPVGGLLDVTLPWVTMAGLAGLPGMLGRIGAITPAQARRLAQAAEDDPAAQWRVIVTNPAGEAIAVARIRRRTRASRDGPVQSGPVGRITLTISQDTIAAWRQPGGRRLPGGPAPPSGIVAAALRTATRALERALAESEADATSGGCAHTAESPGYRPPPRLREYVVARDVTCRNPVCGQPAWRADLDHTIPWHAGGRTCRCNCGGACRRDHQLKQHPRWKLRQVRPGWFQWTAPSGRTYTAGPATYMV